MEGMKREYHLRVVDFMQEMETLEKTPKPASAAYGVFDSLSMLSIDFLPRHAFSRQRAVKATREDYLLYGSHSRISSGQTDPASWNRLGSRFYRIPPTWPLSKSDWVKLEKRCKSLQKAASPTRLGKACIEKIELSRTHIQ